MKRLAVVSGSRIVGNALGQILQRLLACEIQSFTDFRDTGINPCDTVVFDLSLPLEADGQAFDPQSALRAIERRFRTDPRRSIVTFQGIDYREPNSLAHLIRALSNTAVIKPASEVRNPMSTFSEPGLWHDLKYDRDERCLNNLRILGCDREVDKYVDLFERDPESAYEYARQMSVSASVLRSSRHPAHASLEERPAGGVSTRKLARILFVEDQPYWTERLRKLVSAFNESNDDFELDLRYADTADRARGVVEKVTQLQAVVLDYLLTPNDRSALPGDVTSEKLAIDIRTLRPNLPIFGLTGKMPRRDGDKWIRVGDDWQVDRVFYKNDAAEIHELLLAIIKSLRERSRAPFFSALRNYSSWPTVVFHALPLSRGKSVAGSQWAREFSEFYGEGYFAGETSSTLPPLDSLFSSEGSLREAKELAAAAFSADRTFFVTNGTTGANSIVYRAVLSPNDVVLLDRNCHRSHHYASMQLGAQVAYMEPEHVDKYGISSAVSLETIEATARRYPRAKLIALTHPTFDGVFYDPEQVMRRVLKVPGINRDIVFLFDEAWFAYGMFHPTFRGRTAMMAARRLRQEGEYRPRVYATQSIHKTLSAMRQGSMIHVQDDTMAQSGYMALEESLIAHTTTSPNAHILASLDVARMQAVMEGFDLLGRALDIASWIRSELAGSAIKPLDLDQLTTDNLREHADLDPLKISLHFQHILGPKFRKDLLYHSLGIQTNKYSHNTALALVTIGTTWSMADQLVRSLRTIDASAQPARPVKIPTFSGFAKPFLGREGSRKARKGAYQAGKIGSAYHRGLAAKGSWELQIYEKAIGKTAATFVTPYPPGYPVLVPGQMITETTVKYLRELIQMEVAPEDIHGLGPKGGLLVLR